MFIIHLRLPGLQNFLYLLICLCRTYHFTTFLIVLITTVKFCFKFIGIFNFFLLNFIFKKGIYGFNFLSSATCIYSANFLHIAPVVITIFIYNKFTFLFLFMFDN